MNQDYFAGFGKRFQCSGRWPTKKRITLTRRRARVVEWAALEMRYTRKGIRGSNPLASANWNFARKTAPPRGAELAPRLESERAFLAERERNYQSKNRSSRIFFEKVL